MEHSDRSVHRHPVQNRDNIQNGTGDTYVFHHRVDHHFGVDRRQKKSARIVDVHDNMSVFVGHHQLCHPNQTVQQETVVHGDGRIPIVRRADARLSKGKAGRHTHVLQRFHEESDCLVSHTGVVRNTGYGNGTAVRRTPDNGQIGIAEHTNGVLLVSGRHV